MFIKLCFLAALAVCESVLYSSFWAPLFDPRILNYRVDVTFDPNAGKEGRGDYKRQFGFRGDRLIADLGNGKGPKADNKIYNDVKFYYTYGADAEVV